MRENPKRQDKKQRTQNDFQNVFLVFSNTTRQIIYFIKPKKAHTSNFVFFSLAWYIKSCLSTSQMRTPTMPQTPQQSILMNTYRTDGTLHMLVCVCCITHHTYHCSTTYLSYLSIYEYWNISVDIFPAFNILSKSPVLNCLWCLFIWLIVHWCYHSFLYFWLWI